MSGKLKIKNLFGFAVLSVGLGFGHMSIAQEELSTATDVIEVFDNARALIDENIALRDVDRYSKDLALVSDSLRKIARAGPALAAIGIAADVFSSIAGEPSDTELILDAVAGVSTQIVGVENSITWSYLREGERQNYTNLQLSYADEYKEINTLVESWSTIQNPRSTKEERDNAFESLIKQKEKIGVTADGLYADCVGATAANMRIFDVVDAYTYGDIGLLTTWGREILLRMAALSVLESYVKDGAGNPNVNEETIKQQLETKTLSMQVQRIVNKQRACDAAHKAAIERAKSPEHITRNAKRFISEELFRTSDPSSAELVAILSRLYPSREWVVLKYAPVWGFENHYLPGGSDRFMLKRQMVKGVPQKYNVVVHHFAVDERLDKDPQKLQRHVDRFVQPSIGTIAMEPCGRGKDTRCYFRGQDLHEVFGSDLHGPDGRVGSVGNGYYIYYPDFSSPVDDMDLRSLFKLRRFQYEGSFTHKVPFIFWAKTEGVLDNWDFAASDPLRSWASLGAFVSAVWSD